MKVHPASEGQRLDQLLSNACLGFSRTRAKRLITDGQVLVNGQKVRPSYQVSSGEQVAVSIPSPEPKGINPEVIPLSIFFEDDHLLVVNKPAGMMMHPAGRVRSGTLVNALLGHCKSLSEINGELRPGIVHRLDKDTSGLVMIAKGNLVHQGLAAQLKNRNVTRRYKAIVWGRPSEVVGQIEGSIGRHKGDWRRMVVRTEGRYAVTNFELERVYDFLSLLWMQLETGRTHQIRVHLAHIGHSVFGDALYSGRENRIRGIAPQYRDKAKILLGMVSRQMLHAEVLGFVHPVTRENLQFQVEPPNDMMLLLNRLGRQ